MSGVTKHIFNQEVRDILSMWDCEIKTIEPLLPKEYSSGDIITLLKEFYPHEWHSVEIKYVYYQTKDRYIKRKFGKSRYHMKAPEVLLMDASRCKKILSKEYQRIHFDNYNPHKFLIEWEVDRPTSQMSSQWDIHLKNQSEPCVVNLSFHTSFH